MSNENQQLTERDQAYWKKNISIILGLLTIWASVSFIPAIFFASALHSVQFFGVPLSYWFAHQGSILIFVCIIWYYAWRMDKLDKEFGVDNDN